MQGKYLICFSSGVNLAEVLPVHLPTTATNIPKYITPGTPRPVDARQMMKPVAIIPIKNKTNGERCLRLSETHAAMTATIAAVI
jgi:hypothetical protein